MDNTLNNSNIKPSLLKWCRNLIFSTMISSRHRKGGTWGPTNGIDGHHGHVTQLSLVATNKGAELFVQISQEVIDLSVFTVCLKIEARKLESHPAKHVL